jgi:acyl CoA:acetate/3-ketoacid CoA transferase beta subunit
LHPLTPRQLAWRLAQDLPAQQALWLGAGLPQLLHEFCPPPVSGSEGRPIDLAVLTADEVSESGLYCCGAAPSAVVAREVWIIAPLFRDDGRPTLVEQCSAALQGSTPATRLYTDVAIFDFRQGKVFVRAMIEGITLQTLQMELDVELQIPPDLILMQIPLSLGGSY